MLDIKTCSITQFADYVNKGTTEIRRHLKYKCDWHRRRVVRVGRFFPPSKLFGHCRKRNENGILSRKYYGSYEKPG